MGRRSRRAAWLACGLGGAATTLLALAGSGCGVLLGIDATFVDGSARDAAVDTSLADMAVARDTRAADVFDAGGEVDAPTMDGPGACADVDLKVDPANCGRCGHGCLDAPCVESACQSMPVSSSSGTPNYLTVARGNVYWTQALGSAGDVLVAPSGGGNAVTFAALDDTGSGVASDPTRLFFGELANGVYACPRGGCVDGGPEFLVGTYFDSMGLGSLTGFTVTSSSIYLTYSQGYILECPITTTGNSGCVLFQENLYYPASPNADDAGFVWANLGIGYHGGSIVSCPPGASCPLPTVLVEDAGAQIQSLTMDATYVYWTEIDSADDAGVSVGSVMRCVRANCELTATAYAKHQLDPEGIVSDGTNVYWSDMAAPSVLSCPIGGCPGGGPTVLASGDAGTGGAPFQLALDEAAVYWSNEVSGGLIMRVAKP